MVIASAWGVGGMLLGGGLVLLVSLPLRPHGSDAGSAGWEELGWAVLTMVLAIAGALVAGALGVGVGLHRRRSVRPVATALVFAPVALILGALTMGVGALLAPAAAVWLVDGIARPRADRLVDDAAAPSAGTPAGTWHRVTATGLPQRLVTAVVLAALLTAWLLSQLGHRLGGELHGSWYVWLACLPLAIVVPTVLLWRRTPWFALAGVVTVLAAFTALAEPGAVAGAHPTPEKLRHDVAELGVPDGYRVASSASGRISDAQARYGYELPVVVRVVALRDDSAPPSIPEPLRPAADGTLADSPPGSSVATPLPATSRGQAAARAMKDRLLAAGWEEDLSATDPMSTYWLPRPSASLLNASSSLRLADGPWVRAHVVPLADAALVVVSTRP
jgi:hypothetical protein